MSHLLKALKSLESRGAAFAPSPAGELTLAGLSMNSITANRTSSPAELPQSPASSITEPQRVKPRRAARVRPRRAANPVQKPAAPRPVLEALQSAPPAAPSSATLAELCPTVDSLAELFSSPPSADLLAVTVSTVSAPAEFPEPATPVQPAALPIPPLAAKKSRPPSSVGYPLAPAIVVNQAALAAGAALALELAVEEVVDPKGFDENVPHVFHGRENSVPQTRQGQLTAELPARSATPFEHRVRETLMHPARSRPFAELVERLRQDFRGSQTRSLLFTGIGQSSHGDEMLAHVAALFAERERVLLVDADVERAGLTAAFSSGASGGFQEVLSAPSHWQDHLLPTAFANLALLPSGRGNANAKSAPEIASLIPILESKFPLVLIDGGCSSSPLAAHLARSCDATYFVIRLGSTDASAAQAALRIYRSAGARVMGCVAMMGE